MKTLEKKSLKSIKGGTLDCSPDINQTTICIYSDGAKICVGQYTWSGETLMLKCTDGKFHTIVEGHN